MSDAGGIGILVALARGGTDAQKELAAGALRALGADPTNPQAPGPQKAGDHEAQKKMPA
jgi:hypothetical protein